LKLSTRLFFKEKSKCRFHQTIGSNRRLPADERWWRMMFLGVRLDRGLAEFVVEELIHGGKAASVLGRVSNEETMAVEKDLSTSA
jgi:hypothetical protein